MEEVIKELEELIESVKEQGLNPKLANLIGELIGGYRTLEKHIGFYEKNGSYKARIIELEDQVEELKNLANNKQWISPCYVAENYIARSIIEDLIKSKKERIEEMHPGSDCVLIDDLENQIDVLEEVLREG